MCGRKGRRSSTAPSPVLGQKWWRSSRISTPSSTTWTTPALTPSPGRRGPVCPLPHRPGGQGGDKVAVWATNVPAWFITFWAATKIGAVLVTVKHRYKITRRIPAAPVRHPHPGDDRQANRDSRYAEIIAELCRRAGDGPSRAGPSTASGSLPAQRHHVGYRQAGCLTLGGGRRPWPGSLSPGGPPPGGGGGRATTWPTCSTLRQHRLPQGSHAHPYYKVVKQRQVHRRPHGPLHRRPDDDPGAHVSTASAWCCPLTASRTHGATMCPLPYFSKPQAGPGLRQPGADHHVQRRATMFIAMMNHPDFPRPLLPHSRTGIMAGPTAPRS